MLDLFASVTPDKLPGTRRLRPFVPPTDGKAMGDGGAESPAPRQHREGDMGDRDQLHDLRQQAHDAGIEGNSKMTEDQLRDALRKVGKGERPQMAKHDAKR